MKKLALALFLTLQSSLAWAGCSVGALPFQLQNNTIADATQVMADFNQITTGIGANCAAAGVNNDITSLNSLSTPLSPTQGGSPVFNGGFTGGSVNAQTLTVNSNFTLTTGYIITGIASFTNTGFLTMTVNSSGAGVLRNVQNAATATVGGDLIAGHAFTMIYDGTNFRMLGHDVIVGEMRFFGNLGQVPPGWLIADGSSFSCAALADLCAVLGTTFGGTGANPLLPDTRGRVMAGLDNYGTGAGAAGRLTNAATGCGTTFSLGATCANANQSHTQLVAELAQHNHGTTESPHTHSLNGGTGVVGAQAGASSFGGATGLTIVTTTGATSTGLTVNNNGSSQAMPIVNPNLGMVMIIRF